MAVSTNLSGGVAVIRVDEPLDTAHVGLRAALGRVGGARAVVLAGCWACGTDIRGLLRMSSQQCEALSCSFRALRDDVAGFRVPVVAAIAGSAVGHAAELAMSCHHRVLARTGGLGRVTGTRVVFGERISADRALCTGLVDRVVPAPLVLRAAVELANGCKPVQAERKCCPIVAT
ncbi:enoyl-CoA hydratase/isomerase family protein [Saccharothrix syringae]|uniref:Enoyl-CoA hydratase/isomerase family protein n=1 Tax=Saccharothrix syringae TaxID=103733 RepID=A0A5Q0H880_SACSY|nr:enoyl-CoA hydratase/isomerase family protein [Saccharothrix syringae]QFZ22184.1 enoyl-CoA hydratase/isomerase family protein [Saccharothrix syringae]